MDRDCSSHFPASLNSVLPVAAGQKTDLAFELQKVSGSVTAVRCLETAELVAGAAELAVAVAELAGAAEFWQLLAAE